MPVSEKVLLDIAEQRPENLLLVDTKGLLDFSVDDGNDVDLRCAAIAELVSRWCLSGDGELAQKLSVILGAFAWRAFSDWYNVIRPWTGERSLPAEHGKWQFPPSLPGLEATLRRRLSRLFSAAGFIPVYNSDGAWFLPFSLDSECEGAVWSDGTEIAAWREPVCRVLADTEMTGIRIQLANGPELAASVSGTSLMLPVWVAAMRGKALPEYDVLRVLATGSFDDSFRLSDVEVKPKLDAMKRQFRDAIMFAPNLPGVADGNKKCFFPIDAGLGMESVLAKIRDILEQTQGLVRMTRDYAIWRLPDMNVRVDRANFNRWNNVATQLEQLKSYIDPARNPDKWLEFSSLLATALCHAGRTVDSQKCTLDALSFAKKNGYTAKALRLQVTAAVNVQDMGELEEYKTLVKNLAQELESFCGPERDDLLMRFHGTAAQAHAFGAVYGIDGFSRKDAMDHVEKALGIAYSIADGAASDKRDDAESNVAQDLNYRHLMFALFKPGSAEENGAYANAQRQLNELSRDSAQNNRYHQMRQRSLAYFNAWREGKPALNATDWTSVRLPSNDAEGWLVAANRRHIGALAASAGEMDEAVACFAEGEKALPLDKCWAPVLASIRLALLVQAACSLAACGKNEESAQYADLAEKTDDAFVRSKLFGVINAKTWMEALRASVDPRALPAFYY